MEIWKSTPFENIEISNFGNVRKNNALIKKSIINGRYIAVTKINKKIFNLSVSRMVATAFLPNTNNAPDVLHRDGNKLNNNVNNLYWGYRERKGNTAKGEQHGRALITFAIAEEIREKRKKGHSFAELAENYGVSIGCIQGVITRTWKKQ